jgi:hypothetical protein
VPSAGGSFNPPASRLEGEALVIADGKQGEGLGALATGSETGWDVGFGRISRAVLAAATPRLPRADRVALAAFVAAAAADAGPVRAALVWAL